MTLPDFLFRLDDVRQTGPGKYMARCPCHDDATASLSVTEQGGRILLNDFGGCTTTDIVAALGLTMADLFTEKAGREKRSGGARKTEVATYVYNRGALKKTRFSDKSFVWHHLDANGNWQLKQGGIEPDLFMDGDLLPDTGTIFITEGEKDVLTLAKLGEAAVSLPNGSGSKWLPQYAETLRGRDVVILPDNDSPGAKYAAKVAGHLKGIATSVRVVPITDVWPNAPKGADISDLLEKKGEDSAREYLFNAMTADEWSEPPAASDDSSANAEVSGSEDAVIVLDAVRNLDPANNPLYSQADELAFGRLFADVFRDRARFNETARCWYVYDGVVWRPDREGLEVDAMAKLLQRSLWSYCGEHGLFEGAFQKFVAGLGQRSRREKIILDAKSYYPIHAGELDSQPYLLNTQNCVIDLRTGDTLEHDPSLLLSQVCNCEYNPDANGTLVRQFIGEVMSGDEDKAQYLQSICGYALMGECEQEEMYLLYGATTRNGKSTLCDTLEYMVGGYGAHIQPETLAAKDRNSRNASGDIARLDGVRFLHCSEPPKRMVFDIALLKTMTGRDTITARNLYEREFEFVPVFTLIVNSNYLPIVNDDTFFTSGRCKVIHFDRHFTADEQDTTLKARLREPENLSALLNWCLEGLQIYRAQGNRLIEPQSVIAATEAYREQSDKLKAFILDCFVAQEGRAVTAKQAYASYQGWCQDNGYGCENKSNFLAELRSKGLLRNSATVNGRTFRNVILGYSLDTGNPFCE